MESCLSCRTTASSSRGAQEEARLRQYYVLHDRDNKESACAVARLQQLLEHILCRLYGVRKHPSYHYESPGTDWYSKVPYIRILCQIREETSGVASNHVAAILYDRHIEQPARALGLPSSTVDALIVEFFHYRSRPSESEWFYLDVHDRLGARRSAQLLENDEAFVIDRVVSSGSRGVYAL
jgi:hypothetical protein